MTTESLSEPDPSTSHEHVPPLSLRDLIDGTRHHWRENPLVRRTWRRIRPYVLLITGLTILTQAFAIAANLITGAAGNNPLAFGLFSIFAYLGVCLFTIMYLIVWLFGPALYAYWAYRDTFLNNDQLRTAAIDWKDRLLGILVPGVAAIVVVNAPFVFTQPVVTVVSHLNTANQQGLYMYGGPLSLGVAALFSIVTIVLSSMIYMLFMATVALRVMLLDKNTGATNRRGIMSVVWPHLVYLGISFGMGFVFAGPYVLMSLLGVMWGFELGPEAGWKAELFWSSVTLLVVAVSWIALLVFHRTFRVFWKIDLPLAQRDLFVSAR